MASTKSFLDAVKARRSYYALSPKSPIPNARIQEIVNFAITHVPSTYNVQSARAVILYGDEHKKLWSFVAREMQQIVPEGAWEGFFKGAINGHKDGGYATVMFFEDQSVLDKLAEEKKTLPPSVVAQFSDHSAGMHHFTVWTALEAEGFGANLQHYTTMPPIAAEVTKTWNLPESWKGTAQLVFGTPVAEPGEKTFESLDTRVKIFE